MERLTNGLGNSFLPSGPKKAPYGNHPIHESSTRPLHVVIVGAGPSGIALSIQLKSMPHVTYQVFEKNADVGGTWFENRYPGAACDVASHAYQYTFAPNPNWSHHFAPAEEIGEYFKTVAARYELYDRIKFNAEVTRAEWDEELGRWAVAIRDSESGASSQTHGDIFINAGGILNAWKWPEIPGLRAFTGPCLHTASWDPSVDLQGKRIGVIGSGATGAQLVPQMQKIGQSVTVFVRSPSYILPHVGFGIEASSYNEKYSEIQKQGFRDDAIGYKRFRKAIEQQMNENFRASIKGSVAQQEARSWAEKSMREAIISPELQHKLIPDWELGCRRITPGRPYLEAVQELNVEIERSPIDRITESGIHTSDGVIHELDAIVCATGFDTSFRPRYPIIGRNRVDLRDLWGAQTPEAYLGLAVSGFPNYFTVLGPNCPIANGSLIPCIEWSAKYIGQVLQKMQACQIRTVDAKCDMQNFLNEYMQTVHRDLVWSGNCVSWYKERKTGKVTAVWPGSSIHYMEAIEVPRWEDFDIGYCHRNPFMFLGRGESQREAKGEDLTFYLPDGPAAWK
ncbi:flavin-binding monooxygenase [Aspergillus pseudoustus]|uniref:Flavin-binding monooxygenase n=1 Tax=Aspergillus pseudoustus TaxID=1810923 RepID=A0ABR4L4V5_9EURO